MCLLGKKLYLVTKSPSFAENGNTMSNIDFELICTLICNGDVESIRNLNGDDNVFYDELGMSCMEVIEMLCSL